MSFYDSDLHILLNSRNNSLKMEKYIKNCSAAQLETNIERRKSERFNEHNLEKSGVTVLRKILYSTQMCLVPKVHAAPPDPTPTKPPPMKYIDLSMYDCPHKAYKNHVADKDNCPEQDVKILHEMLLPTVSETRKSISDFLTGLKNDLADTYNELSADYKSSEKKFLSMMRDPEDIGIRFLFVGTSALAGLRLGKTITRRVLASGIGLFVSGSICFPEETDELARTLMYRAGKAFVPLYNLYFGTDWELRERVPCARDMPEVPPPTKPLPGCSPGPKK